MARKQKLMRVIYLNKYSQWKTREELLEQLENFDNWWVFTQLNHVRKQNGFLTPRELEAQQKDIWPMKNNP